MASPEDFDRFTSMQFRVWNLVARGKPNKVIAYELCISESTVKVHIRALMRKFKLTNRVELALEYYPINWRRTS